MVKILLAEDEPDARALLTHLLTLDGFEVRPAADARQMHAMAERETFDVVLLDWILPYGSGVESLAFLARLPGPPKIVVLTALTMDVTPPGADAMLVKPVALESLEAVIRGVVQG